MPLNLSLSDLSELGRIRSVLSAHDVRQQFAPLDMSEVHIRDDVLDRLPEVLNRLLSAAGKDSGARSKVAMMADPILIRRDGDNLKARVMTMLQEHFDARSIVLDDGHPILHADEPVLDAGSQAAEGLDAIISVGSGTVTDVAKIAAARQKIPVHVVIQTAASVDGFTDNFSVVLQNGVKKTLLSRWPDAVLTDTRVIAEAPHYLNASGFGELLSMYSAPGDWYLAHRMGMDSTYATVLLDLLALCGDGIENWAEGIGKGDADACARLAQALAMRGIVTGVGGTTAALSGMEHLISHMFDMVNAELHEPTGLHGAQVGVGSVIRAAAWEVFCERFQQEGLDVGTLFRDPLSFESEVKQAFAWLDPSGRIGSECWQRFHSKLELWQASRPRIEAAFADWKGLSAHQDQLSFGSHKIARYLHQAGSPKRFTDLQPAPTPERVRWVVANCQFMRERFTVADLLFLAGWLDEEGVDRILQRVQDACSTAERQSS